MVLLNNSIHINANALGADLCMLTVKQRYTLHAHIGDMITTAL